MRIYIFYSLLLAGSLALLIACGSGDYTINPDGGLESQVGDTTAGGTTSGGTTAGTTGATPQQYFTDNLWPIMKLTSGKGCASGGCHNLQTPQTFYQVDPASASNSWNWASVRRKSVDTSTGYARSSSVTLRSRKNSNHNSFQNWTSADKALIDAWVALP